MKFKVTTGSYKVGKITHNRGDIVETDTDLREVFGKECFELVPDNTSQEDPEQEPEEDDADDSHSEQSKPKRKAPRRRRKKK